MLAAGWQNAWWIYTQLKRVIFLNCLHMMKIPNRDIRSKNRYRGVTHHSTGVHLKYEQVVAEIV